MKDDIFNPNSYTEKAMPLTSAFCKVLCGCGDLGKNSDNIKAIMQNDDEDYRKFTDTLSKEQKALLSKVEWNDISKNATENTEYFCRGMKFGIMLMKELLG